MTNYHEAYRLRNAMWKVGAELLDSNSVRDKRSGQLLYENANVLADAIGEDQRQHK